MGLGEVIDKQVNKRASDSSLYPRGHGLKNCAEVRQQEKKMLDRASPFLKEYLEGAISENRDLRAPRELKALSAKTQEPNAKLNPAQTRERAHIISDATDAVVGKHWEDADLKGDDVTKNSARSVGQAVKYCNDGKCSKIRPSFV